MYLFNDAFWTKMWQEEPLLFYAVLAVSMFIFVTLCISCFQNICTVKTKTCLVMEVVYIFSSGNKDPSSRLSGLPTNSSTMNFKSLS